MLWELMQDPFPNSVTPLYNSNVGPAMQLDTMSLYFNEWFDCLECASGGGASGHQSIGVRN